MKTLQGWIFDVYPSGREMVVRVVDTEERVHRLLDRFAPAFWVGGEPKECRAVARFILEQSWNVKLSRVERLEPSLAHPVQVLHIEVENPHHFKTILERVRRFKPKLAYHHDNVPLPLLYLFAHKIAPLMLCDFVVDGENHILAIQVIRSSEDSLDEFTSRKQSAASSHSPGEGGANEARSVPDFVTSMLGEIIGFRQP